MTTEEINIAIAEWCGWKVQHEKDDLYTLRSPEDRVASSWRGTAIKSVTSYAITYSAKNVLPSYTTDLNAMHEAEKGLITDDDTANLYSTILEDIVQSWMVANPDKCLYGDLWFWLNRATARQRAEALLRTIGKWKE